MNRHVKRVVILIIGWGFILVGIVGLFLPVLQGVLFLLIGLVILSSEYKWARRLLLKLKERFPRISNKADEAARRGSRWLQRLTRQRDTDWRSSRAMPIWRESGSHQH